MQADDSYWRRPDAGHADPTASGNVGRAVPFDPAQPYPQSPGSHLGPQPYSPPPPTASPPAGWHPEHVVEPPPPRQLPPQDDLRIDQEEAQARTITLSTGLVVGVILLALLCVLCGRMLA